MLAIVESKIAVDALGYGDHQAKNRTLVLTSMKDCPAEVSTVAEALDKFDTATSSLDQRELQSLRRRLCIAGLAELTVKFQ
jgi:hypothetical protein